MKSSSTSAFNLKNIINYVVIPLVLTIVVTPFWRTFQAGHPWKFMYPNFIIYTGIFFPGAMEKAESEWDKVLNYNEENMIPPTPIPEIPASEYSIEALRKATNNWRSPAIVRNLFNNTAAMKSWTKNGVLADRVGDVVIPVTHGRGNIRVRVDLPLKESLYEVMNDPNTKKYIFFPISSRKDQVKNNIHDQIRRVVLEDLETDTRIKPHFATKRHMRYVTSQIIVGQGQASNKTTTGSEWHCAIGNNYFVQVAGRKRWYFMDPQHSAYMLPIMGGRHHFVSRQKNMEHYQNFLPIKYTDTEPGDLLYNPDWQWHSIYNYEGLSMAVAMREATVDRSLRNNLMFTSLVLLQETVEFFGIRLRRYPEEDGEKMKEILRKNSEEKGAAEAVKV